MSTGNWFYDNLMARRQAREIVAAFEASQQRREQKVGDGLARSAQATDYCSKCGRQWKKNYYRASTVFRWFILGVALGAAVLQIALHK